MFSHAGTSLSRVVENVDVHKVVVLSAKSAKYCPLPMITRSFQDDDAQIELNESDMLTISDSIIRQRTYLGAFKASSPTIVSSINIWNARSRA